MTGVLFDIKEFAVFDGPGIRTTVFMKGCPLRCRWCHNPEGLLPIPQIMVSKAACVHCGACEKVCRHPEHCIACGECIAACRGGFRKLAGTAWTEEQLAQLKVLVENLDEKGIRDLTLGEEEICYFLFENRQLVYWSDKQLSTRDLRRFSYDRWEETNFDNARCMCTEKVRMSPMVLITWMITPTAPSLTTVHSPQSVSLECDRR